MPEIYGIIGTILGTILGWFLNYLSKAGKLHIYSDWSCCFQSLKFGSYVITEEISEASYFEYEVNLDIHNDSGDSQIMRKIEVVFFDNNRELFRNVPYDITNGDEYNKRHKVTPITVPAKSVKYIKLHSGVNDSNNDFEKIKNANRIMLSYHSSKNKEKIVFITNLDFTNSKRI